MATQPSANPKNLFAFLLGMLTLTQGLVLPTESLLLRRAAKPRSVTNSRKPRAIYGTIAESSVPRGSSPREPNPSFAPANSDVIQPCGPFRSGRANLSASVPCFAPCSLGCEVRYPSPTSYCGAQLEHSCFRIRRSWPENGLSVRRSLLNPNNRTWDGSSC